ncbi:hypothetical protein OWM07_11070 [Deferribacter thermophilus]|uniref:hypothetical protein n=1 Tax=Deferribacter thermophilus TaxID=53573 RepID=UPI003C16FF37
MSPADLILKRMELYEKNEFGAIYDLYDENSMLKNFYPDKKGYESFMYKFSKGIILKDVRILESNIKGNFARVISEEYLVDDENKKIIVNKCISYLKLSACGWKILKETREQMTSE